MKTMNAIAYEYTDYMTQWNAAANQLVYTTTGWAMRKDVLPMTEKHFYILRRNYAFDTLLKMDRGLASQNTAKIIKRV